jgi:hypothetical protein
VSPLPRPRQPDDDLEPLAVLLLPTRLEEFELAAQARELLQIPRVIALEPPRVRTPRLLREAAPVRQAKRLRLPGEPRVLVLYHPAQYRLARALAGRYEAAELWYLRPGPEALQGGAAGHEHDDLLDLDNLAVERATEQRVFALPAGAVAIDEPLRARLRQLGIISARPFVPGARL